MIINGISFQEYSDGRESFLLVLKKIIKNTMFASQWSLPSLSSPFKFKQRYANDGCQFSLEKTHDVEDNNKQVTQATFLGNKN